MNKKSIFYNTIIVIKDFCDKKKLYEKLYNFIKKNTCKPQLLKPPLTPEIVKVKVEMRMMMKKRCI